MRVLLAAWLFALSTGWALAAVNLNTATKDELIALPGIGPAKAQAIIDHRTAHGPFKSVEELKDVKGIGAKRFEKLKPELTVAGSAAKAPVAAKVDPAPARSGKGEIVTTGATKRDAAATRPKP
ncbi:MAG: helix-hairpin-helix domain-containing protein [Betaproteobacteria bacterium]|jgi:competence protein ComEA|nr:helix-hairpin-helix domain-containing protein [Betaproteobacteria bacterium]MBK6601997.1 helix-hairpin-helix domain-containing protein [Betaproteobacteria bacterium]MBK7082767.1 helix-hairpin-helix domain-containing protein [Betaproteobacteria bacterium]MBK7745498.1 helix-hairpin-helix domain-containing protein [Betaproteobacteria bacterium]MBK8690312.1 helix-hairpin-helix domain-containing protein [Betaproteobacteria bacterium]